MALNLPVKSEQKAEVAEVLQAVDEDRKFVYQATIVRLMKSRKVSRLPQSHRYAESNNVGWADKADDEASGFDSRCNGHNLGMSASRGSSSSR